MRKFILVSFITLLTAIAGFSQSATTLRNRCPNTSIYSIVQITGVGDINIQPCPNKTTTFTQNVVLPAGTVIAGGMFKANNGTAALPSYSFVNSTNTGFYRSAANSIGVSTNGVVNAIFSPTVNSQQSAGYTWQNVAADADFSMGLTPAVTTGGSLIVGDCVTTPTVCLSMTQATGINNLSSSVSSNIKTPLFTVNDVAGTNEFNISYNASTPNLRMGDCVTTPTACLIVWGSTNSVVIGNGSTTGTTTFEARGVQTYQLQRTITAPGTTGNQTINSPNGSVNIAAAGTGVVITNSTVAAFSTVIAVANTNDTTCSVKNAVPTANTITITMTTACTDETRVSFWVFN